MRNDRFPEASLRETLASSTSAEAQAKEHDVIAIKDPASIFGPTERTVIALAFTSGRECADCAPQTLLSRLGGRIFRALVPEGGVRPLANNRLEALRRLACASYAAGGEAERARVEEAEAAGLTSEEIEALRRLAASWASRPNRNGE